MYNYFVKTKSIKNPFGTKTTHAKFVVENDEDVLQKIKNLRASLDAFENLIDFKLPISIEQKNIEKESQNLIKLISSLKTLKNSIDVCFLFLFNYLILFIYP